MNTTKFIFIIPFYNVSNFIKECADSLLNQEYINWRAIFIDDCSSDNTTDNIPDDPRFTIIKNTTRQTALPNIHNAIVNSGLDPEDVICLLDGDDKLIGTDVCTLLDSIYSKGYLLSYGQYLVNGNETQIGHCIGYTEQTYQYIRTGGYWASHLRSFKFKLYQELMKQDSSVECHRDRNGNFYQSTYDISIMCPILEIAGFKNIYFNPKPIYYYRLHNQNDHAVNPVLQRSIADEIFSKKPFKKVF